MGEILSIRAITDAQTKAYSSGLSATCNSLSELRRRLNSYKDASDGIAKLGIVQAAQGVRRVYNYEYWSMKSALDYAEAAAASRPHRKWYGVRRNVRSAAIVESGQVRAMVIEGRKREAISTSAYQSGNKVKFEHQHAPEGKNWAANLLLDTMEWFLATGAVSLAFSGYEIFFAKGTVSKARSSFCVADTGDGIKPDFQATVFDRFEARSGGARRRGAGLGLSLVRSFVELHGGWVTLESDARVGTRVTCHLPRRVPAVPQTPGADARRSRSSWPAPTTDGDDGAKRVFRRNIL